MVKEKKENFPIHCMIQPILLPTHHHHQLRVFYTYTGVDSFYVYRTNQKQNIPYPSMLVKIEHSLNRRFAFSLTFLTEKEKNVTIRLETDNLTSLLPPPHAASIGENGVLN